MIQQLILLCGIPGSGKSTFVKTWMDQNNSSAIGPLKTMVLSTDDIIEAIAKTHGLTYNDVFGDVTYAFAERMMHKLADHAFDPNNKYDVVIWDQTNLNVKTRARKLARVPADWLKSAVYFPVPDDLDVRLASRPGKHIPKHVIENMKKTYTHPTCDEGFDFIVNGVTKIFTFPDKTQTVFPLKGV